MYFSFNGLITYIDEDYIVIEVNDVGYQIFVPRTNEFSINEKTKIYVHNVVKEDEQYLVGFSSFEEKKAFMSLISVKGIGPKTALNVLSQTDPITLFKAISANNVAYLKKLPGIGAKAAAQIILDLKGQLTSIKGPVNVNQYDEVKEALKSIGFKTIQIDKVLCQINIENASNEEILKEALKLLKK